MKITIMYPKLIPELAGFDYVLGNKNFSLNVLKNKKIIVKLSDNQEFTVFRDVKFDDGEIRCYLVYPETNTKLLGKLFDSIVPIVMKDETKTVKDKYDICFTDSFSEYCTIETQKEYEKMLEDIEKRTFPIIYEGKSYYEKDCDEMFLSYYDCPEALINGCCVYVSDNMVIFPDGKMEEF